MQPHKPNKVMLLMCQQPGRTVLSHAKSVPVSALVVTVVRAPIVQTKVNAKNVRHVTCSLPHKKRTQNRAAPTLPPPQMRRSAPKHPLRLQLRRHRHPLLCRRLWRQSWHKQQPWLRHPLHQQPPQHL